MGDVHMIQAGCLKSLGLWLQREMERLMDRGVQQAERERHAYNNAQMI